MIPPDSVEKDILENTNIFERVIDNPLEGIAIINNTRIIEYINDRACEILSKDHDEIIGHDFLEFIHPDYSPLLTKKFECRKAGDSSPTIYEAMVLSSSHNPKNVRVCTCVLNNGSDEIKILAQVIDITEQRRAQLELSEYRLKYQTLVDTMNEGVGIIDDKGDLTYANEELCKILGYSSCELLGRSTHDIFQGHSTDFVFGKIRERISNNSSRYESSLIHKSGNLIPIMISASPLFDSDGEYVGSQVIITDITTQKINEIDLQKAKSRATLYLDVMRHDLRNHLQRIQVETELLLSYIKDEESVVRLNNILQTVSESASVISETHVIEHIADTPLRERSLDKVVHDCVMAAIIHFDSVDFRLSTHVSNAMIMADDYLELLLSTLIEESCRHNLSRTETAFITLSETKDSYLLSIATNGDRMPVPVKSSLMGTTPRMGGLCFHVVRQIAQKYGLQVEVGDVTHVDGSEGSVILVTFPRM